MIFLENLIILPDSLFFLPFFCQRFVKKINRNSAYQQKHYQHKY